MHSRRDFALLGFVAYYSYDRLADRQEVPHEFLVERAAPNNREDACALGFIAPLKVTPKLELDVQIFKPDWRTEPT